MAWGQPLLKCLNAAADLEDYREGFLPQFGKSSLLQLLYHCFGQEGAVQMNCPWGGWAISNAALSPHLSVCPPALPGPGCVLHASCSILCQQQISTPRKSEHTILSPLKPPLSFFLEIFNPLNTFFFFFNFQFWFFLKKEMYSCKSDSKQA